MEVRFQNLSLSASIQRSLSDDDEQASTKHELPTIPNTLRKAFRGLTTRKDRATKHILRNFSGVFAPGTMTLVLGQPGSGKSALMKLLSGRFPMASNVRMEGDVTYNGASWQHVATRLPQYACYVSQRDVHFPTLSVHETLAFAHACCGDNASLGESEKAESLRNPSPEAISHLGLQNCQDTVVGDAVLRGVSGGERKRVTLGEMQFGDKPLAFLDEISTGLDSAATYDIVKAQRTLAHTLGRTVVIALLQPSPEVFALFDDVLILNDGYVMYHGPRDQVVPYFHELGLDCVPTRDQADFLVDLGTPQQAQYETSRSNGAKPPRTAHEFAELFERSSIHEAKLHKLQTPCDPALLKAQEDHFDKLPAFHQPFLRSLVTLVTRQLKITFRNRQYIYVRAFMVFAVSLILASLFWQFDPRNIQVVMGVSFQGILFLDLGQVLQLPIYMDARGVFYKQRGAHFFRTSTYVLASSIAQIPIAGFETLVFSTLIYWMCGFESVFTSYLVFMALVFLTNMVLAAFFFVMAALCKNLNTATPASLVAIMIVTIFSGFIVSKDQIPSFMSWLYWISPVTWCVRGVAINQYTSAQFNVDVFDGIDYKATYGKPMGEYLLSLFGIEGGREWVAVSFAVLVGMYALFLVSAWFVLEFIRYESPEHVHLSREDRNESEKPVGYREHEFALIQTPRADQKSAEVIVHVDASHAYHHDFTRVTVAFKDLWYSVPNPAHPGEDIDLLKGISGLALPGTMTALMGSSGAGKTTLMDVIAGRKTGGKTRGQILLNGHPATDLAIRRSTGYCEQMDIHAESSTFREALTFSAFLRQGAEVPDERKLETVEECLDLLDLRPIADQIIRGSSVEQMKRLTIGVELAAQPSVLFLDEPTSGLDARAAKMIMDGVRKVADTGRTVLCTIHQPSWEVFQVFDSLLLLQRGGETVYFGELGEYASELVEYLEAVDGVPRIEPSYNPATWMLEIVGAGVDGNGRDDDLDFAEVFASSDKKRKMDRRLREPGLGHPSPEMPALAYTDKRAASQLTQAKFLLQRFRDLYWRTPSYNITRFVVVIFFALVFGLTYVDAEYDTYQGINSGQGLMYYSSLFLGIVSFNSAIPLVVQERPSFYRERAAQTYSAWWYFVGGTLVELPYILSSSFVFTAIFFPLVGFTGVARFFLFWINLVLYVVQQTYWAQVLVYALPSIEVTSTVGMFVLSVAVLFAGYNPPANVIPTAYKWVYYLTSHTYTIAALSASVFGDCPGDAILENATELACQTIKNLPPTLPSNLTIKQYIESAFLMKHDEIGMNMLIVTAFIVLVRLMALLALQFLNFSKR